MRWLAVPTVAVGLLVGLWLVSGVIVPGYWSAIVAGVAWFVVASVALGRLTAAHPRLRLPVRTTFLAVAAASAVGFWWTSVRETKVDEALPVAVEASETTGAALRGEVVTATRSAIGTASVGAGRLRLSRAFEIDGVRGTRVLLEVAGRRTDLGPLRRAVGAQSYPLPKGPPVRAGATVLFWNPAAREVQARATLRR